MGTIIELFTRKEGIITAIIVFLGVIATILGIIHKIYEIRKNSRDSQKNSEPNHNPNIYLQSKSSGLRMTSPEIEEYDWKNIKELRFQIINDGEITALVKKMKIMVINFGKSNKLKMIRPGAPLQVYHYKVELNPIQKEYDIISPIYTDEKPLFYYKKGEADSFLIKLSSKESYWYDIEIIVEWYDSANPQEARLLKSAKLHVEYSIEPEEIIKNHSKMNV